MSLMSLNLSVVHAQ